MPHIIAHHEMVQSSLSLPQHIFLYIHMQEVLTLQGVLYICSQRNVLEKYIRALKHITQRMWIISVPVRLKQHEIRYWWVGHRQPIMEILCFKLFDMSCSLKIKNQTRIPLDIHFFFFFFYPILKNPFLSDRSLIFIFLSVCENVTVILQTNIKL